MTRHAGILMHITSLPSPYAVSYTHLDDLEEFGLAEPSATITMRFNDGSSVVCLIGDQAPSDEETRYLSLEGSSYVYIVGADHHLLRSAAAYADLTVVEAPQEEEDSVCLLYTSRCV